MATYRGLSNQGATCYMNSLLQTLYMTPDLRQQLYLWSFSPAGKSEDSIPYQLQLLFGRLQLAKTQTVETKGLTRSFQWDLKESFVQHDVQEFCRVLFDAIERSVKGTAQSSLISDLYEGLLEDYVKCSACGTESKRQDKFLDVSLAVRNHNSLEKALSAFVKAETLSGDNQYSCDMCKSKQNAVKGLRFKAFPRVFVVQLKRFDLDLRTFTKKKLNDFVSFPFVLNLNPYLQGKQGNCEEEETEKPAERQFFPLPDDLERRSIALKRYERLKEALNEDRDKSALEADSLSRDYATQHGERLQKEQRVRETAAYLQEGEQVYELFSVMVHSGSALGGHYYAYIWSFEQERWLKFNDSNVKPASMEEVKSTFGGENRGVVRACANAYLLTYRKVTNQPICNVPDSLVPEYIRREVSSTLEEGPTPPENTDNLIILYENQRKVFKSAKSTLLKDFMTTVLDGLGETDPVSAFRLRSYRPEQCQFPVNYAGREDEPLGALRIASYQTLVLEKREKSGFVEYDPNAVYLRIVVWKEELGDSALSLADKVAQAKKVAVNKFAKMQNLLEKLSEMTGLPGNKLALIRKTQNYSSQISTEVVSTLSNLNKSLWDLRLNDTTVLYLEAIEEGGAAYHWLQEFQQDLYRIQVRFNSPNDPVAECAGDLQHKVLVDSRADLRTLKGAIAAHLSLAQDTFILRRGYLASGPEVRNLDCKLNSLNMGTGACLHVELGVPLKADQMRIGCTVAGEPGKDCDDNVCFTPFPLFSLILNQSDTVRTAKSQLIVQAKALYPSLVLDSSCCFLREQVQDRLGRLLRDTQRLQDLQFFEQSQLCIQHFSEPIAELGPRDIAVACRRWRPSLARLDPPLHILVNKGETHCDLGTRLGRLFAIPAERIEVYKVPDLLSFSRAKLGKVVWTSLRSQREKVETYPVSLFSDGHLLIVKDRTEAALSLPVDKVAEKPCFSWKRKEKAITITVKGEGSSS